MSCSRNPVCTTTSDMDVAVKTQVAELYLKVGLRLAGL
jgi:hypothetical protein